MTSSTQLPSFREARPWRDGIDGAHPYRLCRQPEGSVDPAVPATDPRFEAPEEVSTRKASPPLRSILIGTDLVIVAIGWAITLTVAFSLGGFAFGPVTATAQSGLMLSAGCLLLSAAGLYRRQVCAVRSIEVARIGRVSLAMTALSIVVLASTGREVALLAGMLGGIAWFVLLVVERGILREWINGRRAIGDFGAPILVVGGGEASTLETADFLADNPVLGFEVIGVACPHFAELDAAAYRWLGASNDVLEQARRAGASGVVIDSSSITGAELNAIARRLEATGIHVHISSGLRGIDVRRISVSPLADETFLHVAPFGLTRQQVVMKRALDVVGASIALLLLSPVLLLAGLLVWAGDRGPVLFRQQRSGKHGELFGLLKLRTMVRDAERLKAGLAEGNQRQGPLFKLGHDPRVTTVGRFLRAASIDEIPQLFNVLQGTMSLVGPRPALPEEVAQFDEQLTARLTVKPGVTGLWQVEARDLANFDLYRRYDLLYVQNWSLGVDVAIILRTVVVVALRTLRAMLPARLRAAEIVQ